MKNKKYKTVFGADPYVIKENDNYYYIYSTGNSIELYKTNDLFDIKKEGETIFKSEMEVWAPEIHKIDEFYYVYFAMPDDTGENETRRMHVLKSNDSNIDSTYSYVGKISDDSDKWAIDGTVLKWKDNLYFIWSGWEGNINVGQNIYIAHMSSPTEVDGKRVMISTPKYPWEQVGLPINEGPEVLIKDDKLYIIYSASGAWTKDYCLGMLTLKGKDILNKESWIKSKTPVFSSANGVYGVGHACFLLDDNENNNYIIYHAYRCLEETSNWDNRVVMIKKFSFDNNVPVFGVPTKSQI